MITTDTMITSTIDWLSVTSKTGMKYPTGWTRDCKPLENGMLNYNRGVTYSDGRIELWHDSRVEMGTHLIMGGECLRNVQINYGTSISEIVSFFSFANTSRIDLVVDVRNGYLDIAGLAQLFERGECTSRADEALHIRGVRNRGETLYIGGAKSDRRLRIYDKAAESKTDNEWTRIELQVRHKLATRTVMSLISKNVSPASIASAILDFANWEKELEWITVMGNETLSMGKAESVKSRRRQWILDTCARAIANEAIDAGDDIIDDLERVVRELIKINDEGNLTMTR